MKRIEHEPIAPDFKALVDAIPNTVWVMSPDGHGLYFNRRWCDYTGLGAADCLGDGWRQVIHAADLPKVMARLQETRATRTASEIELRARRVDGEYRWCLARALPQFDADGELTSWNCTGTDIHDARCMEQRWNLALEAEGSGVWDWDLAAHRIYLSPQYRRMLGHDPVADTVAERQCLDEVHPDDVDRIIEVIERQVRNEVRPRSVELRIRRRDGGWIWVEAWGRVVERDAGGAPTRMIGTSVDITRRVEDAARIDRLTRHLEDEVAARTREVELEKERLAASEAKFRRLFECAPIGIAIADLESMSLLELNDRAAGIMGYPKDELVGRTPAFMTEPEDMLRQLEPQRRLQAGEIDEFRITKRYRHKDGGVAWVDASLASSRDEGGRPIVFAMFQDVTEREAARATLQDAVKRLELALEAGSIGTWYRDLRDGLLHGDARAAEMFGVGPGIGEAGVDLEFAMSRIHGDDRPRFLCQAADLERGDAAVAGMFRIVLPDGRIRYAQSAGAPQRDSTGRPNRVVGVVRDVSAQIELEARLRDANKRAVGAMSALEQHLGRLESTVQERTSELSVALRRAQDADRAKNAFLLTTSHQLRTPLNAVVGFTECLLSGTMGPVTDEQREPLELVLQAGRELSDVVQDILYIASIEGGNLRVESQPVRLRGLLEAEREAVEPAAEAGHVDLRPIACDGDIVVRADAGKLGKAIRSLLRNAVTYTDHGHVEMCATLENGYARVEVRDSGVGVPIDQQGKLFQPFQPIDGQPGPSRRTTGLGLAITRRVVEAMGGEVGVESRPGEGSTFWLKVPLAEAA